MTFHNLFINLHIKFDMDIYHNSENNITYYNTVNH